MKHKLLVVLLVLSISNIYSQKTHKWRNSEIDSITVAQVMYDDQNYIIALPFFSALQQNHPDDMYLKYVTGVCCLFQIGQFEKSLNLLLEVYAKNKKADDIEYYLARAYHYNNQFDEALSYLDKYLNKKGLTGPQKRNALLLVECCKNKKMLIASSNHGRLEDYIGEDLAEEKK
jgi:tetratricopeptide (TPR) repeat protein